MAHADYKIKTVDGKKKLIFSKFMFAYNPDKSFSWVSIPFPAVKELGWDINTRIKLTVEEDTENTEKKENGTSKDKPTQQG